MGVVQRGEPRVMDPGRVKAASPEEPTKPTDHWLLTSPGTQLKEISYYLDSLGREQSVAARLSPVALLRLLPKEKRPQKMLVLVTEAARQGPLAYLEAEAQQVDCEVTPVDIPDGKSSDEIWEVLSRTLAAVPPGIRLTLDITHGFRSLPFVYLTATLFLTSLRNVTIEGVYYGMLEMGGREDPGPKPLVNLAIVPRLAEWFYATRIFRETGQAQELVRLVDDGLRSDPLQSRFVQALARFSRSYAAGLPLEMGQAAAGICSLGRAADDKFLHVPAGAELLRAIMQAAEPFGVAQADGTPVGVKEKMALTLGELEREARLIDLYLQREQFATAIQTIREWMVNRVLLAEGIVAHDKDDGWLNHQPGHGRTQAEQKLNVLRFFPRNLLTNAQRQVAEWWRILGDARNEVAHCGFRRSEVDALTEFQKVREVWQQVRAKIGDESFWQLRLRQGEGTLLVNPVGTTRGSLFTALRKIKPRWLLPVVSPQTEGSVREIAAAAGFDGSILPALMMNDPFTGYGEILKLIGNRSINLDLAGRLLSGQEVVVNLTGGTTVMQQLAQKVGDAAERKLDLPVRTLAAVDRRSRAEQETNPYVEGEIVWLSDDSD